MEDDVGLFWVFRAVMTFCFFWGFFGVEVCLWRGGWMKTGNGGGRREGWERRGECWEEEKESKLGEG